MAEDCCHTAEDGSISCTVPAANTDKKLWPKIRSGVMFGIACITSPCCTPLIVPLGLGLLAGTPAAVWLSNYIGWLYAGLTLLSILSLIVGLRWARQKTSSPTLPPATQPTANVENPLISKTAVKVAEL